MRRSVWSSSPSSPGGGWLSRAAGVLSLTALAGLDVLGILLFATAAVWTLSAAAIAGGTPGLTIALLLATGAAFVIGRLAGSVAAWLAPAVVAVGILLVVGPSVRDVLSGRPQSAPLGYANANAALLLQAAIAALIAGAGTRSSAIRWLAAGGSVLFGGLILTTGSFAAGSLLVLPLAAVVVPFVTSRSIRAFVLACAGLLLLVLLATTFVGILGSDAGEGARSESPIVSAVSPRRIALWRAAVTLMLEHPLAGVGPGRFDEVAPPALRDPDARQAHNDFLQQGAETGIVGLVLLLALFVFGFARLWAVARPSRRTALAATALAVLGIHACIDYVLRFPAVSIAAALLVGAGMSADRLPSWCDRAE